jgi:hypothetical protein
MSTPEPPHSDLPPVPRYGEYAPVPPAGAPQPAFQAQPYGSPAYYAPQTGERPPRTADMIVSIVLLVIGFFSVLVAVLNAFTISTQMQVLYEDYGVDGTYRPGAGVAIAAAVLIISHLVLYVLALVLTITLIRKHRISFWLPLTAGAIASIIFFVTFVVLIFADPALTEVLMNQAS